MVRKEKRAKRMEEVKSVVRGYVEDAEDSSLSLVQVNAMAIASRRILSRRNSMERFQSLRSSLKSAKLVRAKSKIKQLAEKNKKLKEELKRAKEEEESSKQILELKTNMMLNLWTTIEAGLKEASYRLRKLQGFPEHPEGAAQLSKKRNYVVKFCEGIDCFNCPICLEPWSRFGEHDICSLSCGHFFGRSCITHWISRNGSHGFSACPVCSSIATLSDIRCHHVSQIYDRELKPEQAD